MRRFCAIFFLLLYFYNIAGYLTAFLILQYRIRGDMKEIARSGLPDETLTLLVFSSSKLENGEYPLQWLEEREFRYGGAMYDVVRSRTAGDTTYLFCINDIQEERLFANLDRHVEREMNVNGRTKSLHSFQDVFKESYGNQSISFGGLTPLGLFIEPPADVCIEIERDTPFHPPHIILA